MRSTAFARRVVRLSGRLFLLFAVAATTANPPDWVAARGRVVPGDGLRALAAPTLLGEPPIVATWLVAEGEVVAAGQPLARLAVADALADQVEHTRAQVAQANATVAVANAERATLAAQTEALSARRVELAAALETARLGIREAEAALAATKARGDHELVSLRASIEKLTEQRQSFQRIIDENDPPRRERVELEHQRRVLGTERAALEAQVESLQQSLESDTEQAQRAVDTAAARLQELDAQSAALDAEATAIELRRGVLESTVAQSEAQLAAARASVTRAEASLQRATILAPTAGRLVQIHAREGMAVGPEGLASLAPSGPSFIEAEVYLDEVRHVRLGQSAKVSSRAFEGELAATVVAIESQIGQRGTFSSDPAAFADALVRIARLRLESSEPVRDLIHAPVTVRIRTAPEGP